MPYPRLHRNYDGDYGCGSGDDDKSCESGDDDKSCGSGDDDKRINLMFASAIRNHVDAVMN